MLAQIARLGGVDLSVPIAPVPAHAANPARPYFSREDMLTFFLWSVAVQWNGVYVYDGTDAIGNPPPEGVYAGADPRVRTPYIEGLEDQDRILDYGINVALENVLREHPEILELTE